jgi:hypothetical protein
MGMVKFLVGLVMALLLAACGGGGGSAGDSMYGGGSGGDSDGSTATPTVSLSLSGTTTSTASPLVGIATVLDAKGAPVAGALVTFSTGTSASLSQTTSATNSLGQASVTVYPAIGVSVGADALTAKATVTSAEYSSTKAFSITTSATQAGIALVLSSDTVSTSPAATVTATVRNVLGVALSGQVVSFSTNGTIGSLSAATALTDSNGVATVSLSAADGASAGASYVTASTSISGVSYESSRAYQVAASGTVGTSLEIAVSRTTVSLASPAIVSATVTSTTGGVANQLVRFTTTDGAGSVSSATALTSSSGVATVTLTPATGVSTGTADYVVATTTLNSQTYRAQAPFQVQSTSVTGTLTVNLSSSTVSSISPGTVTASLKDASSNPIQGQVVTFATDGGLGSLSAASALTDANGNARVLLSPKAGLTTGADYVSAAATVSGAPLKEKVGFQIGGDGVSIASLVSGLTTGTSLSAYGQTNVTVTLGGVAAGTPVTMAVGSSCVDKGKATFLPASTTTTSGTATFTFRDIGCGATAASDNLKVTLSGTSVSQSLVIPLSAPEAANIQFASATPETVYIKGSGFAETSTVVFKVTDLSGNALPEQQVEMCLSTLVGGLTLDGSTGIDCSVSGSTKKVLTRTSNSNGEVSVMVNSGTVPTPVRVIATLVGKSITTVSSNLAVAVGLPSQLNFSLSQGTRNIEGMNIDGTTNTYSIIASDRMGNPVPVGTTISFVSEGGQVEASKQITLSSGLSRASVNFVSAEPRPRDGRITVLAYALGEESFLDLNGNNIYDNSEDFFDLGDLFVDRAFNGQWDPAEDQYVSLSLTGTSACRAATNSILLGGQNEAWVPSRTGTCNGVWGRAYVRRAIETVFSTSSARPVWSSQPANSVTSAPIVLQNAPIPYPTSSSAIPSASFFPVAGASLSCVGKSGTVSFLAADANTFTGTASVVGRLNPLAAGTKIEASTPSEDLTVSVIGGSPVPSTTEATAAAFSYTFGDTGTSGTVVLKFSSPSGLVTSVTLSINRAGCPP